MNTWPDQWYHTSQDRPDKIDPTQMKRATIITAAAAYTIAAADDRMAGQIAGEIVGNAAGRLSHQLVRGLEEIKRADKDTFPAVVKKARTYIEASAVNERATLDSVRQLVAAGAKFGPYLEGLKAAVTSLEQGHLRTFDENTRWTAALLGLSTGPAPKPTEIELKAAKIVPKPLPKIKAGGYQGYRAVIQDIMKQAGAAAPTRAQLPSPIELQLLCDGRNSALTIKKMLDTQFRQETSLEAVLVYLDILKKAGLIAY
jgi:aminopeptidase YwaD